MRILPLALLVACSGSPTPTGTPPTDSGTTTGTPGATTTGLPTGPGEVGHLVYWWEDAGPTPPMQQMLGVFAPHFDGLAVPAPCAANGALCVSALPATDGSSIDATPSTFDAIDEGVSWLGNTINVGGFDLPFEVNSETGFGFYRIQVNGSALDALDVRSEGEWGEYTGAQVLPVGHPIDGLDPAIGAFIEADDGIDIQWTPGASGGVVYLEVRTTEIHKIWRFADSGSLSIDNADLGDWGADVADVALYRVEGSATHDVNGNTLTAEAWSSVRFRAAMGGGAVSCKSIFDNDPASPSGVYAIQPDPALGAIDVWCDMTTDGGGWTLVASSKDATFNDQSVGYSSTLITTTPATSMTGVWSGLRFHIQGNSDIRFTCKKAAANPDMFVDLSFYDVDWYRKVTNGPNDSDNCFFDNGNGFTPPARKNNMSGVSLPLGDPYGSGTMEGEDSCSDTGDFTVDFDDRGMDSNQSDGTDWGEDDSSQKCGDASVGNGGAWFIFVREL